METLNLGILAHVDAGKTSLTERILYETGVIAAVGRVDHGTTQTDTLSLERQRGITIQTAVASFTVAGLTINLVDTPGHADFIAEVDRALQVLDAVVIVISAVDGVQPQTQRLVRAVRAARLPLVFFINKIDQIAAQGSALVPAIAAALDLPVVPLGAPAGLGTRDAAFVPYALDGADLPAAVLDPLAALDERVLAAYLEHDGVVPGALVRDALWQAARQGDLAPAWFGSAITGAGVTDLLAALPSLRPAADCGASPANSEVVSAVPPTPRPERGEPAAPEANGAPALSALVFKVQRAGAETVALARIFTGTLTVRDEVARRRERVAGEWTATAERVTGLDTYVGGATKPIRSAGPGAIVRVHGLGEARVGDVLGEVPAVRRVARFPAPTLESVVEPAPGTDLVRLNAALQQLEAQDPLISLRRGTREPTVSVRLYGEVQKEVLQATLRDEFQVAVGFAPSQTICIERVTGTGAAREAIGDAGNPFWATVGFRIEPAPGAGIVYQAEPGALPHAFYRAIEETVHGTLEEGLLGWPVRNCRITLLAPGYSSVMSTAGDFRKLTPLVLMRALLAAGTEVCEPIVRFTAAVPEVALTGLYTLLHEARAVVGATNLRDRGELHEIEGEVPAAAVDDLERALPALTSGRGSFGTEPAGYRPVAGAPPARARTDCDPLNRKKYLALVSQM